MQNSTNAGGFPSPHGGAGQAGSSSQPDNYSALEAGLQHRGPSGATQYSELFGLGADTTMRQQAGQGLSLQQIQQQLSHVNGRLGGVGSFPVLNPEVQSSSSTEGLLEALGLLQKNIGALQALVPLMASSGHLVEAQQQQAAAPGVAAIISQLAQAAAGILPQVQRSIPQFQMSSVPSSGALQQVQHQQLALPGPPGLLRNRSLLELQQQQQQGTFGGTSVTSQPAGLQKDEDDENYEENLPKGSYTVVELDAVEIMAEHTHFCEICHKGFKRDANLRMHMRGHGDEYKTTEALQRPEKGPEEGDPSVLKRYSCPFPGCKRNKSHEKFQPLKTMLCVKNHYRRSHCPKILVCSKCGKKKFSVVADLKTHEKHCGRDKWTCSCGTTFSRKDKLLGHLQLFAGHTPLMPLMDERGGRNAASNSGANSPLIQRSSGMLGSNAQHLEGGSTAQFLGSHGALQALYGQQFQMHDHSRSAEDHGHAR